jgi:hypothetical protein
MQERWASPGVTNGATTCFGSGDDRRHEGSTITRREPLTGERFPLCLFTPLVESQLILAGRQRSIRQICHSAYIETAISFPFVGMTDVKADRYHCPSYA